MARQFWERKSIASALLTYLQAKGWNITEVREGFPDEVIALPTVAIHFPPTNFKELEMGRGVVKRNFSRRVQFDAYMENENRANAIADDIMDFVDEVVVVVTDNESNELAQTACFDTSTIIADTMPPFSPKPAIIKWRGIVKATYETMYFN